MGVYDQRNGQPHVLDFTLPPVVVEFLDPVLIS